MRRPSGLLLPVIWITAVSAVSILAPLLTRWTPSEIAAPPLQRPALHPPMGSDELGRDEWSRMLYGGRISLAASLAAAGVAVVLGSLAAVAAIGLGAAADATVVGGTSAALAIPSLLLALLVVAALGPGIDTLILAVGLGLTPGFARLARAALLKERAERHITAATALGAGRMETTRRHLIPNALPALLSIATTHYAWAFGGLTTLTFLGLAGEISRPEWGALLNAARPYLRTGPWLVFFPAAAIALTILSVHSIGASIGRRDG